MIKVLFLLFFPVLSFAQSAEKEFTLKGELKLARPIDWIYLRYVSVDQSVYDSLQTKNGEFKFEGKIGEPTVASLIVKFVKQPGEEKAQRDFVQVFLEPAKLELVARDSLKNNSVKGSPGHDDFTKLMMKQQPYGAKLSQLYEDYSRYRKEGDESTMKKTESQIDSTQKELNEHVYEVFVKNHPNSLVALYALKQYAGWDIDPDKVEPLFNSLSQSMKQWPSAKAMKNQIEIAKKTAVGRYAMDFVQNDTLGNPVSLSSFKGRYVFVDFWASWCGPCRAENPNIVKTFAKYKDKNFTILGVSLDRPNSKNRWLKAIHDDGLTWYHVSDLKFWDNEVAKQYGIRAIPQNLLIDPKGMIIAKNLSGEDLDKKLADYVSK